MRNSLKVKKDGGTCIKTGNIKNPFFFSFKSLHSRDRKDEEGNFSQDHSAIINSFKLVAGPTEISDAI